MYTLKCVSHLNGGWRRRGSRESAWSRQLVWHSRDPAGTVNLSQLATPESLRYTTDRPQNSFLFERLAMSMGIVGLSRIGDVSAISKKSCPWRPVDHKTRKY